MSEDAPRDTAPSADDPASGGPDAEELRARLNALRERILEVDEELIRRVGERRDLVLEVGSVKEALGIPVMDPGREARVVRRAAERARALGVDEELVRDVVWRIIAAARQAQEGGTSWGPPELPGEPDDPEDPEEGSSPDDPREPPAGNAE